MLFKVGGFHCQLLSRVINGSSERPVTFELGCHAIHVDDVPEPVIRPPDSPAASDDPEAGFLIRIDPRDIKFGNSQQDVVEAE